MTRWEREREREERREERERERELWIDQITRLACNNGEARVQLKCMKATIAKQPPPPKKKKKNNKKNNKQTNKKTTTTKNTPPQKKNLLPPPPPHTHTHNGFVSVSKCFWVLVLLNVRTCTPKKKKKKNLLAITGYAIKRKQSWLQS